MSESTNGRTVLVAGATGMLGSAELAFRAVGRKPRIVHLSRRALVAGSVLLRPVHPWLSEVTDFASRALTNAFVAPLGGHRRLADHFAAVETSSRRAMEGASR